MQLKTVGLDIAKHASGDDRSAITARIQKRLYRHCKFRPYRAQNTILLDTQASSRVAECVERRPLSQRHGLIPPLRSDLSIGGVFLVSSR